MLRGLCRTCAAFLIPLLASNLATLKYCKKGKSEICEFDTAGTNSEIAGGKAREPAAVPPELPGEGAFMIFDSREKLFVP